MKKYILASLWATLLLTVQAQETNPIEHKKSKKAEKFQDPVCKMNVSKHTKHKSTYNAKEYGFCAKSCKESFDKNPTKYVSN